MKIPTGTSLALDRRFVISAVGAFPGRTDPAPFPTHAEDVHRLPLLGEIAAGGPLLADENVEDHVAVPGAARHGGADFLLRVKGDSMVNAGILDGDLVVVRRAAGRARRRDRRRAGGRRRVGRRGDREAVLPRERPRPAPARERRARADLRRHVQILGKVVGVLRVL